MQYAATAPGWCEKIEGMEVKYREIQRISYSGLKQLSRSPAHYWDWFHAPEAEPTPALVFGSLAHCLVLEPEKLQERYAIGLDIDRRANANKAAWAEFEAENAGKTIIKAEQLELAEKIKAAVFTHPSAALILGKGEPEKTVLWTDADTGAECKCRIDFVNTEFGALADFKTCADAGYDEFSRAAFNNLYYAQAAMYLDGYNAANGTNLRDYFFICAEKESPFGVACYLLDQDSIELGRAFYKPLLKKYVECRASGAWPCYEYIVKPLSLPRWAFK
jgi:hypothetical protein